MKEYEEDFVGIQGRRNVGFVRGDAEIRLNALIAKATPQQQRDVASMVKTGKPGTQGVSFSYLPDVLKTIGSTFDELGCMVTDENGNRVLRKLDWPTDNARKMCELCDSATDADRKKIFEIVEFFAPKRYIVSLAADVGSKLAHGTNGRAIWYAHVKYGIRRMPLYGDDFPLRKHLGYLIDKNKHYVRAADYDGLLNFAHDERISPHWLLCMRDEDCLLAKYPETEQIMDMFLMISDGVGRFGADYDEPLEDRQKEVIEIVEDMLFLTRMKGGRVENGKRQNS